MHIKADLEIIQNEGEKSVAWIHRRTDDADIYFISNQQNVIDHGVTLEIWERRYASLAVNELDKDTARLEVAFRITDMQPELWDAVTGARYNLPEFRQESGLTIVPLSLPPSGSCFIVFRHALTKMAKTSGRKNFPELRSVAEIKGPWVVSFDPKWGGPPSVVFEKLEDWTKRPEPGIKFYSGRATYKNTFDAAGIPGKRQNRVYLDLGTLRCLAEVRLNGKDLGILWCPSWRVEVTGLLKPTGNKLEIDIINVWANRLIGDADLPEKERLAWSSLNDTKWPLKSNHQLIPSGLYGPVALYVEAV